MGTGQPADEVGCPLNFEDHMKKVLAWKDVRWSFECPYCGNHNEEMAEEMPIEPVECWECMRSFLLEPAD